MSVDLHSCSGQTVVIIEDFFAALGRCVQEAEIPEEMRRDLRQFFTEAARSPAQVIAASANPDLYVAGCGRSSRDHAPVG